MARAGRFARVDLLIGVVLVVVTLAVYWQVTSHGFVDYDDDLYVTGNPHVNQGLTRDNLAWAMTAEVSANWHPVTLVSHMLDAQLYGLDPGGHHLTSLLLHLANTLLLFIVLRRMTAARWPSALTAALFALHPLHVESVAWIAERKDVLSTTFLLLTLWAWIAYTRRPAVATYLSVIALFALGLMSKPMLVTLPFALVLLDFWPLKRLTFDTASVRRRVVEKVPLLVLAAASSVITLAVQQASGAVRSTAVFPLGARIANALVSYVAYLAMTLWPSGLAVLYPHPSTVPWWEAIGAGLVLIAVSWVSLACAKRWPYVTVGWLWYVGTLVPVIGLVQVGVQARADRYTYVPLIGIFIVIAWGAADLARRWPRRRSALAIGSAVVLSLLAATTWRQLRYWTDSEMLFEHALDVTTDNYTMHNNLGLVLANRGRAAEAIRHYSEALRINPGYAKAHNNLGAALRREGRTEEAIAHFSEALRLEPDNAKAHNNMANCLVKQGRTAEAVGHYEQALRLDPGYVLAHYNLAISLEELDQTDAAMRHYSAALQVDPGFARAHNNLGNLLRRAGRVDEAIAHYTEARRLDPDNPRVHNNLGVALREQGRIDEAIREFSEAVRLDPGYDKARRNLESARAAR